MEELLKVKKRKIRKIYFFILPLFFFFLIIMLYKVFTPEFAVFSDNVIRPVLGVQKTLALERYFFNLSDSVNSVIYKYKKPNIPQFSNLITGEQLKLVKETITKQPISLYPILGLNHFPLLKNENIWQPLNIPQFTSTLVAATTFVRPDPNRSYAITDILKIDMTNIRIGLVAGTKYPGGVLGNPGPGIVPLEIQKSNNLIAAFSGGFVYSDGMSGMIVGNKVYTPLKKGLATLLLYNTGKFDIVTYTGQNFGSDIVGIRQNCPILIQNGVIMPAVNLGESTWGWTDNESVMYTIRTGIGITKNGNLLFAVGKSLLPNTLAIALKSAGAINAMQLDINPSWTRFILYTPIGNGKYTYNSYDKSLVNGGYQYLHGWYKDFMYLYKAWPIV